MSRFTSPASRRTDEALFDRTSRAIKRLQKQSRLELREKGRREYLDVKQRAEQSTD